MDVTRTSPTRTSRPADPPEATALLGKARPAWDALRAFLDEVPGATSAWKFYGARHGWQLKATMNRRALIYLIPRTGNFTAALALREPAIAALRASKLPARQIRDIEQAPASPEGKPARIVVTGARQLGWVKTLVEIKLQCADAGAEAGRQALAHRPRHR